MNQFGLRFIKSCPLYVKLIELFVFLVLPRLNPSLPTTLRYVILFGDPSLGVFILCNAKIDSELTSSANARHGFDCC